MSSLGQPTTTISPSPSGSLAQRSETSLTQISESRSGSKSEVRSGSKNRQRGSVTGRRPSTLSRPESLGSIKPAGRPLSGSVHERQVELDFLGSVGPQATKSEINRMLQLLTQASAYKMGEELSVVRAACQAFARVCEQRRGFVRLLKAQGIDVLIQAAHLPQKMGGELALRASRPLCQAASDWMDEVDEVEFTELADLMNIARQLGVFDEGVAVSALGAMERFGLHRREHAVAMLSAGALPVLNQILNAHRNAELVQDAVILLYRLCDLPADRIVPVLTQELDLVRTVVQLLNQAPLDMRVQIGGLRLLALWARTGNNKVHSAVAKAKAEATLQTAEGHLQRAGFTHPAEWISAVAGRTLAGATPPPPVQE